MGFIKNVEKEAVVTIPYKNYISVIFTLIVLFFLYKKFGNNFVNKPKTFF